MAQVSRLASACEKPKVVDGVELPLAPERPEEVAMLRRCGGLLREKGADAAIRACVELAEGGDAVAQADVGLLYVFSGTRMVSRNVEQPHMEQAAKWLQQAADQGDAEAAAYLGQMYLNGVGIESDTERALELLHAAAERGSGQAYLGLGMAYDYGLKVEKDYAQAERYYARAVELGNGMAVQHLADLRLKMNPTPPPPRQ
ncbi:MAG: tetratricopeptide repeat protein [Kiloniellales bacterium]